MKQTGKAEQQVLQTMKKTQVRGSLAAVVLALCIAGAGAGTVWADEDLEKITEINLHITAEISAGSYDSDVEVDTDDEEYVIGGAEFTNGTGEWSGGVSPRLEIILYAEDGYYFGGNSKNMISLSGSDADYVSARREDDNTTLVVTVELEELEGEDLEIEDAWWQGSRGRAVWEAAEGASYYQLRLYRDGERTGTWDRIYDTYYDFGLKTTEDYEYYYEVRAVGGASAKGDWARSDTWNPDDDDDDDDDDRTYSNKTYDYNDNYDGTYGKGSGYSDDSNSKSSVYADDHSHIGGPGVSASDSNGEEVSSGSRVSSVPKSSSASSNSKNSAGGVKTDSGNEWKQDEDGWWFRFSDDSYAFNCWQMIDGKWYCFDDEGYLRHGWIPDDGKWYYCGEDGALVTNARTPDGYYVGGDGAWIQ